VLFEIRFDRKITQSDPRGHSFIFPALASLFSAVHDSFLCKKLKTALFKVPDYRAAISAVRDLARGKLAGRAGGGAGSGGGEETRRLEKKDLF
jgi:hypothetical protein